MLTDEAFMSINGTTDSEHFFALFIDKYNYHVKAENVNPMVNALQVIFCIIHSYH